MYRLFLRVPEGLDPIAEIVKSFITEKGEAVLSKRQSRLDAGEKDSDQDPSAARLKYW